MNCATRSASAAEGPGLSVQPASLSNGRLSPLAAALAGPPTGSNVGYVNCSPSAKVAPQLPAGVRSGSGNSLTRICEASGFEWGLPSFISSFLWQANKQAPFQPAAQLIRRGNAA